MTMSSFRLTLRPVWAFDTSFLRMRFPLFAPYFLVGAIVALVIGYTLLTGMVTSSIYETRRLGTLIKKVENESAKNRVLLMQTVRDLSRADAVSFGMEELGSVFYLHSHPVVVDASMSQP